MVEEIHAFIWIFQFVHLFAFHAFIIFYNIMDFQNYTKLVSEYYKYCFDGQLKCGSLKKKKWLTV